MVLDRSNATVWGVGAKAGTKVNIQLNATSSLAHGPLFSAIVGNDGSWSVSLGVQPAGVGSTLTVSGSDGSEVQLNDVAFGDVFLCSGQVCKAPLTSLAKPLSFLNTWCVQSNMEFPNFSIENDIDVRF